MQNDKTRTARTGDEEMHAMITPKIVEITGNAATEAFVGKTVTKRNTANGVVYAIGNTGYVLSSAEYRMFAAAGAIAAGVSSGSKSKGTQKKSSKRTTAEPKKKIAERPSQQSRQKATAATADKAKAKSTTAKRTKKTSGTQAARNIADISAYESEAPADTYTFGADDTGYLETSPFLLNYPAPEFTIDEPKRGLFDRSEDAGHRISKFFDRLGQRGRDKIVASIEVDEDEETG